MHETVTLAADWITVGNGFGNDLKKLIFNVGIPTLGGIFVLVVGLRTRSPGPTIIAAIFAGVVWGLSANMATIKDTTGDTISHYDGGGGKVQQGDQ